MTTRTLSQQDSTTPRESRTDHLYLVIAGGNPGGGARWALTGIDRVEVGRGATRAVRRSGTTLRLDCPDAWMSADHMRFERERAHWVAVDAGSRNGILVNNAKATRAIVLADDVIGAGRSCFVLRTGEPAMEAELELPARVPRNSLATLDPALARSFAELRQIAASAVPVLIGGATGTGKERVAQHVHAASGRSGAYVAVNCGALPHGLVESELFGHKKGAFSGAVADAPGLVLASSGGTLVLDEIGDLPLVAQPALLRVLEEREVRAVGSATATHVDLRIVAATHRDLDEMVDSGAFREDLLARLDGFELTLPALADRRVDLGAMLGEIIPDAQLAAGTIHALLAYSWPRNVRELVRVAERAAALAGAGEITLAHLSEEIATATFAPPAPAPPVDARRDELIMLLEKHDGNVSRVATELGRVRQQVQRWLKRYAIDPERYR